MLPAVLRTRGTFCVAELASADVTHDFFDQEKHLSTRKESAGLFDISTATVNAPESLSWVHHRIGLAFESRVDYRQVHPRLCSLSRPLQKTFGAYLGHDVRNNGLRTPYRVHALPFPINVDPPSTFTTTHMGEERLSRGLRL